MSVFCAVIRRAPLGPPRPLYGEIEFGYVDREFRGDNVSQRQSKAREPRVVLAINNWKSCAGLSEIDLDCLSGFCSARGRSRVLGRSGFLGQWLHFLLLACQRYRVRKWCPDGVSRAAVPNVFGCCNLRASGI